MRIKHFILLAGSTFIVLSHWACSSSPSPASPGGGNSGPQATPTHALMVSTFAGQVGVTGAMNAKGTSASFNFPRGVVVDASGNVYVADTGNELIRKIASNGAVSTLAGQAGVTGSTDATGTSASFCNPYGVAVDGSGNVYVADSGNNAIRIISPSGAVSTLAGQAGVTGSTNATGTSASFFDPCGVAVDTSGNVYVADTLNNLIRKIDPTGAVTTLAGQVGPGGSQNGIGTAATFNLPEGIAVDASGNIYVGDSNNYLVRKIAPGNVVSTFVGSGLEGPFGVAADPSGNLYVTNTFVECNVDKVTPGGIMTLYAGSNSIGAVNGPVTVASFGLADGIAVDSSGAVYVGDTSNQLIRVIK